MSRLHTPVLLSLLLTLAAASHCMAENRLYDSLVIQGVTISPQETIKLPKPVLVDGLDATAQRKAIETLMEGRHDWEAFSRKAVVSPFLLRIADNDTAAGEVGRRVDLYFVAYGSLEKLTSDNYLTKQLNMAAADNNEKDGARAKLVSNEELAKRGLPAPRQSNDPRWVAVESTLLDKVRISATTQNMKSQSDDSVVIASILDSQFDNDAEYPNSWRSISIDDAGLQQIGSPQSYAGLGSYVKATRLAEPAGALFIEYHVVFAEPQGWFHGANLLRSKLPIVAQDMVRKFRRNMDKP
jgi:hypothetical protein